METTELNPRFCILNIRIALIILFGIELPQLVLASVQKPTACETQLGLNSPSSELDFNPTFNQVSLQLLNTLTIVVKMGEKFRSQNHFDSEGYVISANPHVYNSHLARGQFTAKLIQRHIKDTELFLESLLQYELDDKERVEINKFQNDLNQVKNIIPEDINARRNLGDS